MEADIRKLQKRKDDDSDDELARKKPKRSFLSEELSQYSSSRGTHKKGKRKDEGDVLAALSSFRGKLQSLMAVDDEGGQGEGDEAGGDVEVDDDRGFMSHVLHFPKGNEEETEKAERDYEVIDPRMRGAQAREQERERKKSSMAGKGSGGGSSRRR